MLNGSFKENKMPYWAFIILLLTHCYSRLATLDKKGYIEDVKKKYQVEDFLWSGSGDDENETESFTTSVNSIWKEYTTTIFFTTTIIATSSIYHSNTFSIFTTTTSKINTTSNCTTNWNCKITPTPPLHSPDKSSLAWPMLNEQYSFFDQLLDKQYWIITILKLNDSITKVIDTNLTKFTIVQLENDLATLYELAFRRYQEFHLGLQVLWSNRSVLRSLHSFQRKRRNYNNEDVTVNIYNISSNHLMNIVYLVRVSGFPILATTASHDMKYVSDSEVVAQLGYPVLTKAMPYLVLFQPPTEEVVTIKQKYLFTFIPGAAALAFIIFIFIFSFIIIKKYKNNRNMNSKKICQQFSKTDNNELNTEDKFKLIREKNANDMEQRQNKSETVKIEDGVIHPQTRYYSKSYYSLRQASPGSFLSMPSVKDFPSTNTFLPEPLKNILNKNDSLPNENKNLSGKRISRHMSLGDADPGVISPMIWNTYCQLQHEQKIAMNNSNEEWTHRKQRKKFNLLLDDALNIHGHRNFFHESLLYHQIASPSDDSILPSQPFASQRQDIDSTLMDFKIESEHQQKSFNFDKKKERKKLDIISEPRNIWYSNISSIPIKVRPLSAGPFHRPVLHHEYILADTNLTSDDSAIPIISAIKYELDKIPIHDPESSKKF